MIEAVAQGVLNGGWEDGRRQLERVLSCRRGCVCRYVVEYQ
jgi:hypothetical protein